LNASELQEWLVFKTDCVWYVSHLTSKAITTCADWTRGIWQQLTSGCIAACVSAVL